MEVGLVLLGHDGVAEDAAYAEEHGFHTAGFVDSPLLYADPFVSMALTAERTSTLRIGAMLAIPSNRNAASLATAVATVNRLDPGRTFLGIGTGFTGRAVFGLRAVPVAQFAEYVRACRALLDGEEVLHHDAEHARHIRLRHAAGRYVDPTQIPIYMAADGPRALAATGETADGWITSLQLSHYMQTSVDVFADSFAAVRRAAIEAGRSMDDAYTMASAGFCVLDEGESPTSERALGHVGAYAMLPFHAYADNPAIAPYLPQPIRDRLDVYEREVLARFDVASAWRYQETHRGHLSHLLDGEAEVLTADIVRMTTLTGTAQEIAHVLTGLEAAGLRNISLNPPPHLVRETVRMYAEQIAPLLAETPA
jgi:5,10-methylenetetrahydromethanopterin reductase